MFAVMFVSGDVDDIIRHYKMTEVKVEGTDEKESVPGGQSGFWVAEAVGGADAGEIVGCVGLDVRDETSNEGEIRRMVVSPSYRGTGLAGMLLDAVNEHAKARGLASLSLITSEFQPAARRLYERRGWKVEKTNYGGDWVFYAAVYNYRLRLAPESGADGGAGKV
ncbi:hypothetical protein AX16_004159 [Volvariella volvacea WC 439]|nr:hypothetical protein AX16_004159 [Volvariella volvacea WC 439]